MQLRPHFHASFKDLQMRGNEVDVTLATNEPLTEDDIDQTGEFSLNTSVINPAAAAIFQYRTVSGSLVHMS